MLLMPRNLVRSLPVFTQGYERTFDAFSVHVSLKKFVLHLWRNQRQAMCISSEMFTLQTP